VIDEATTECKVSYVDINIFYLVSCTCDY